MMPKYIQFWNTNESQKINLVFSTKKLESDIEMLKKDDTEIISSSIIKYQVKIRSSTIFSLFSQNTNTTSQEIIHSHTHNEIVKLKYLNPFWKCSVFLNLFFFYQNHLRTKPLA